MPIACFRSRGAAVLGLVCTLLACSDDDDGSTAPTGEAEGAVQALVRGVSIDGAQERSGDIPAATAMRARLLPPETVSLAPGETGLMPLDFENPDEDGNPVTAILMQFEGADSHSEVPVESSVSGPAALNFELAVEDDVCAELCDQVFTVTMTGALELEDGKIGVHTEIELMLDCREQGDPERCEGSSGGPTRDAGTGGDAGVVLPPLPDGGLGNFPCMSGDFVPISQVCDETPDCEDGSDESFCNAQPGSVFCLTGMGMVTMNQLCDGTPDCADGSDEMQYCVPCDDGSGMFSSFQLCDGTEDCADGMDEMVCDFTCMNGDPIDVMLVCNGTPDCSDGSDESICNQEFPCSDGTMTVPVDQLCDGTEDCQDGSDETFCM